MVLFKKKMVTTKDTRRPVKNSQDLEEEDGGEIPGMEEEELEDEDIEALEEEEKNRIKSKPLPRKPIQYQRQGALPRAPPPAERYTIFTQPPRIGIVDSETKEIVGEGEAAVLQVLANILTRLERIETNLGSMMGESE